ncbi:uncharacterized protein [Montipora capricornis]|uniref:uncharacterized protein isoform X2 n=1 Tax=Montipora capricornis TaxID=246305 RepID=UPI0035F11F82
MKEVTSKMTGWCVFYLFLSVVEVSVYSEMMFTSPYNGKRILGTVGSSVTLTWSFSGGVSQISWGLQNPLGPTIQTNLVVLDVTGSVLIQAPASYSQRVSGVLVGDASSGQAIFNISGIKKEDQGFYTCELYKLENFLAIVKRDHVQLSVEDKPNITYPREAGKSFIEGSHVNISCTGIGKVEPGVQWGHDGRVVSSGSGTAYLSFSDIKRSDEGIYTCRANNSAGITEKQVNVTVNYKPEGITIGLSRYSVLQGGAVKVTCVVSASNPPVSEYRFFLNGKLRHTTNNSSEITIENLQRYQDNGNYSCEAQNSVGFAQSDKAFLNINVPVTIQPFTKNTTVTEGNPINLTCHANGLPVPSVVWKKDGQEIRSTSLLNIESNWRSDSGRYICIANNTLGKKEMETFVTVNYPAYIEKVLPPSPHESWIAQNVTFVCKANGVPTPTIVWKRPNGAEIKRVVGSENVLRLLMQKDGDFGSYLCEADNTVGSVDKHTVQVDQIRPPDAPTITTQDKDIQVESLRVKWTPPIDNGGSNITGYRVIVLQDEKVILNKATTSDKLQYFVDKGLTKSTNYTLRVSALNKVFEGMADEKNVMTKYQGAPATAEVIDLPAVTKSKKVTIRWNEPQNNGASITLYTVYQRDVKKGDIKGEWIKIRVIKDLSRRQVVVSLEKNKMYEFVVTANNSFGESLREGQNIRKLNVPGDIPEPVNTQVEAKGDTVILSWAEPENNGATIIRYSIYTRIVGDEEWKKVKDLKVQDAFKLEYILALKKGKNYELMVTATNAFGESAMNEDNIQTVEVPNLATPRPLESQKGSCTILHICYISFIVVLVIVIIVLSVVIWKIRRRPCQRCGDLLSMNPVSLQVKDNVGLPRELNAKEAATYATPAAGGGYYMPLHPSGRSWEVSREDVHVIKVIGKGAFSQVAQATVKNVRANQQEATVAVKMLKANAPPSDRKDLLSELELMKTLKPHPHVIKLIGCVTESDPLMVLIEYVPFGDLLGYLRKSRGLNDTYYKNPDVKPETNLTSEQLMKFAWEVADGMCYLSSKKIVHRDLAARNVLVGEGERCKVTDFGMARNVEQDDIYTKKSRGRLPVKWTAYEALFYGVYTTQSDVWSYGVLLYEILTIGGSPYPDTHARLIADKIQQGYRMPKPRHVDSNLYEIMMKCWEEDPSDRPTFEKLRKTMKDMERNHKTYVNLSQYDTRLYSNVSDLTAE